MSPAPRGTDLGAALADLMSELVEGPPGRTAFMLNRGDAGLLRSLDRIPWTAAVAPPPEGGASVAQHVDHLRYGLSLMNRWAGGDPNPFASADWTTSWKLTVASEEEWSALVGELERESRAWIGTLRSLTAEDDAVQLGLNAIMLRGVIGSLAHLAYHLGAIRQVDRGTRGPGAEEQEQS